MGRYAALLLSVLATAGCAAYHPRPIVPIQNLEDFEARRLDAPELGAFLRARNEAPGWPPYRWDLRTLTFAAFFYSPELDVARAQWAVARGGVVTAGGSSNQGVTAAVGYNSTTDKNVVTPWIPEVALDLPLDIAGKRGIRINAARQLSEAARLNVLSAAWQVRGSVRQGFLELYVATVSDSLYARQRDLQAEIVRILEAQLAVGEVSPYEVTQARVALSASRLAALDAAQRRAQARSALAAAVGVPPAALDSIRWVFDQMDRAAPALPEREIRRQALVNRADIRASLAEYEASQAALQLEIRKQYPDFSLGPGYQLDQTDSKWRLGLSLSLPLISRNKGPIAEATARREEAGARFLTLQSHVLAELEGTLASARVVLTRVAASDTLIRSLVRQEGLARQSYQAGETSRLQYLTVESELVAAGLSRLDAVRRVQESIGALEDAMQSPLDISAWTLEAPVRASTDHPRQREQRNE